MASITTNTEVKSTLLLDPWTSAITSGLAKCDLEGSGTANEGAEPSTRASTSTATAQLQQQAASTQQTNSIASKFNLPQPDVLHVLRLAYFSAARHVHKASSAAAVRSAMQPPNLAEVPTVDLGRTGEARLAKRHKSAVGGDLATASRRAVALKRLCNALGVSTQHQHLPDHSISYAVASSRGWRVAMEDTYAAEVPLHESYDVSLFALYDGHGGAEVARYSAIHMGRAIREVPSAPSALLTESILPGSSSSTAATGHASADPRSGATTRSHLGSAGAPGRPEDGAAGGSDGGGGSSPRRRHAVLREAFLSLDRQLADEAHARELMSLANPGALTVQPEAYGRRTAGGPYLGPAAGSTATVALVGRSAVTVAAVGDSRCILGSRAGGVKVMTVDHKGNDAGERERVVRAGCWVSSSGRVCGELDMSRALGDADMKQAAGLPPHLQAVTADPSVMHVRLEPEPGYTPSLGHPQPHPAGVHAPDLPKRDLTLHKGGGGADETGSRREHGSGAENRATRCSDPRDAAGSPGGSVEVKGGVVGEDGGEPGSNSHSGGSGNNGGRTDCNAAVVAASIGDGSGGSGGLSGNGDGGAALGGAATGAVSRGGGGEGGFAGCYLLLGSDGLWNVLDTEAVHEFVMERLEVGLPAETICAQLCVEACVSERTAYDNVTVLLVQMQGVRPVGEVHVITSTTGAEAAALYGQCWHELHEVPESEAPAGPLADAMCRIWFPEQLGRVVGCCPEEGAMSPSGSSNTDGLVSSVVEAARDEAGIQDAKLLDPSPMLEDGPVS